jgi:multiple sugar transport system substrate-binding protein
VPAAVGDVGRVDVGGHGAGSGTPHSGSIGRRGLLRAGALAAGVAGAPGMLTAVARAAPAPAAAGVVLQFAPWWGNGAPWDSTAQQLSQHFIDQGFNAAHRGVTVRVVPSTEGDASTLVAASLSGSGVVDVFNDCCLDLPVLQAAGILVPLNPYLRQDNVNMALWSPGRIAGLTFGGDIVGLPAYDGPEVVAYRQDLLDDFGLTVPTPDWTYLEAQHLWEQCARNLKGQWLYGGALDVAARNFDAFLHGWGAALFDASRTRCLLDTPAAMRAGAWIFGLIQEKVLAPSRLDVAGLSNTETVFSVCGGWDIFSMATVLGDRYQWNLLPMPTWPDGFSTMVNNDFYAINRASKHPDAAWTFLKWAMVDGNWQSFAIRTILATPALIPLWEEWEAVMRSVAPTLRDKHIGYFREAAASPGVVPQQFFLYEGAQADTLVHEGLAAIIDRQLSVVEAFQQTADRVNALEAGGKALQQAQNAAELRFSRELAAVVPGPSTHYAAPPVTGAGVPPTSATALVVPGAGGSYTLLGDGWDVYATSDNCVFACLPLTATEGSWSCRVTAIANLTCRLAGKPALSPWLKVGLMAAGDLSDDPAYVSPHVTGANQIEWQVRAIPGTTPAGSAGLVPEVGGKPVASLTQPLSHPGSNLLRAPVWLRLDRRGAQWTPYASLDGSNWTQLAPPSVCEMAGCWLGIFACAHNGDFGDKGYIRAGFDHLSFRPTRFVQVGQTGTPPSAGPVPTSWATMAPLL